jgi:hypothetical protein
VSWLPAAIVLGGGVFLVGFVMWLIEKIEDGDYR